MDHNLGYTTNTRDVPIGVFLAMIESDIKKLIQTHGHKNCGLRHVELCEKIRKIIYDNKNIVFQHMSPISKKKWNSDWDSRRSKYFNKLFQEEGFINMCFPTKYTNNPSLYQLMSKHIDFCKKKDEWRATLEKTSEYSECVNYNSWIETERKSFTVAYLKNVKDFTLPTVTKYFSTKEHPKGHDPLETYRKSKLNCTKYYPPKRSHPQKPIAKGPAKSLHPLTAPDVRKESQGKGGSSMPDRGVGIEKKHSDAKILPKTEPSASDSLTSLSKTKVHGTDNGQDADLKTKGTVSPINAQGAKGQHHEATDRKGQSPQQLPEPPSSISPKDSLAANVPDTLPPLVKDQVTVPDSTPSTTSATSHTTHSTQNVQSSLTSDVSLAQPQPPDVAAVIDQYSKEPTPPDPVGKSTDQDASLISALGPHSTLDPGLVSVPAAASNSSVSAILSTTVSTTSASTAGSSPDQDLHLITITPQSTATTPISTTPILTQTTTAMLDSSTSTVSSLGAKPIPGIIGITSTTDEHGKPKASTVSDSQNPNFVSSKKQNDTIPHPINAQSPGAKANLNINQSPSPPLGTPHDTPLGSHPGPPSVLSTGMSPERSPGVLPSLHDVVTNPDGNKITSPRKPPQQSKDTMQISGTFLPKGTEPSNKLSITLTKILPLTSIIPTIIIILTTITLLFLLYKYTPIGLFLGRRKRRKKRDLRRMFVIPEEPTYKSPYKTMNEWDDHNLGKEIMENDIHMKLLEIKRYKQTIQKKKKKKKTTLIEMHMEVLKQNKNDEWKLYKGDFLEICVRGFINQENETYQNIPKCALTVNNNNWIENHRNILEQWKKEEWFHILKNKWRNEKQKYKEKNDKLQENILNEQETHSIVSQKDIWKQWISKQATLIDTFKKEDWFKSMVYVQDKEKDNYCINEYNNITVTTETQLKNEKSNHENCRIKNIIQKLMVHIHMMVLEECIKEDIIKHKELCIDNFIEDIHNENNYDEKRNIPQCDTDDFKVLEFEEIHASRNK
ncbi:STP1 protein [Plasmodium ovale]|uniref:STP1 protein n=1 Tax=Plasmodium ovale TaxID=36330 RepID=A0A1D3JF89_PLAOA|nr:STP1 protein [Plasmodium ovale]